MKIHASATDSLLIIGFAPIVDTAVKSGVKSWSYGLKPLHGSQRKYE